MTYYKVRPEFDNATIDQNHFLVENELITPAELRKLELRYNRYYRTPLNFMRMFDKVTVSKRDVYFFFGARYANSVAAPNFDATPVFSR